MRRPARRGWRIEAGGGAIVVLKSQRTVVAAPDGPSLAYEGGGPGLATGGSGDVLAGIAGGLLARGADPFIAAAWSVWLHGEAGKRVAKRIGPIGFLARELLVEIPWLLARA
jgi:ADP-dependent NAD(P)H-hydrate dehydratase